MDKDNPQGPPTPKPLSAEELAQLREWTDIPHWEAYPLIQQDVSDAMPALFATIEQAQAEAARFRGIAEKHGAWIDEIVRRIKEMSAEVRQAAIIAKREGRFVATLQMLRAWYELLTAPEDWWYIEPPQDGQE